MRLIGALKTDIRFQHKQGFYAVYVLLTLMYLIIIQKIPSGPVKDYAVPLVIFSDPSMVGYFFIGGIVMLEKQQGVLDYLAVTPLSPMEYLISKSVSLGLVAAAASFMITASAYRGSTNWFVLFASVFLISVSFTLYGFMVAAGCRNINQYFVKMIPFLLLAVIPCFSVIGFRFSWIFRIFPNVSGLMLVLGAFRGIHWYEALIYISVICIWDILFLKAALNIYGRRIISGGGAR
jgi:hypothetical protein